MPAHYTAIVGVAENGNGAALVTVGSDRTLRDRRDVTLTHGLPTHPYHHEGAWAVGRYLDSPWARPIPLADAIALIERVHVAAERGATEVLEALARAVPVRITGIALRACPPLPPTIEARIADNRAQTMADSVMYRQAMAAGAIARGWSVHWYEREHVAREAAGEIGQVELDALLTAMGRAAGKPWQAKHKLAATAALAAITPA